MNIITTNKLTLKPYGWATVGKATKRKLTSEVKTEEKSSTLNEETNADIPKKENKKNKVQKTATTMKNPRQRNPKTKR